ncbi:MULTISPECIES: glycosyltransferase family 2 protein [unclassified Leifsonia]|uniref:glycosyltransferase family 2 protein n=1 Tax=unclassified Leifsonia TaxID=2663824 RepID=UPI0006F22244|nr:MULTISPECIES: hypothetical protein [unclassified Leifsonia]KQX06914.1 glycosyltransferase [Leifsonia sp. Root1293]KRA11199.1 glycosyltransferase [Leifsonia sp. Root60]
MTGTRPTRAVITLCSTPRVDHLRRQLAALEERSDVLTVLVWLGDDEPPSLAVDELVMVPPGTDGLRLAAARNAGADRAVLRGADLLIFLDADCVPGLELVGRYAAAAMARPDAVLCGPVTYLAEGIEVSDVASLGAFTRPHPARPAPPDGELLVAVPGEYELFWSLSFALTAELWASSPRFDERYEGYGGEDTDFAFALRSSGIPLVWIGGAHAYHQYHPTSSPPWRHLDDIIRNGGVFAERWKSWPMAGWLKEFAAAGAIERVGSGWQRTSRD